MSIGNDIGKVVELAAPEVGLPVLALKAIGCILAIAAIGAFVWWLLFAPRAAIEKSAQVQTRAQIGAGQAGAKSGQDAIKIIVDNGKQSAAIDAAVTEALHAIAETKGANQQLDPALDDVGRRSICLRDSAAGLLDCQPLRRSDP